MTPHRRPACADLTAPCAACFVREVARLCDEVQPALDACRLADECDALMRPPPVYVTTNGTDAETLRALGLDDASLDAATVAACAEAGDAAVRLAGAVLSAWRDNPFTMETPAR